MQTVWRLATILSVTAFLSCGTETIVHNTDERQANRILEVLADNGIRDAAKTMVDTGREVYFTIAVPRSARLRAIRVLNDHELPDNYSYGSFVRFSSILGWLPTFGIAAALAAAGVVATAGRWKELLPLYLAGGSYMVSVLLFYNFGRFRLPFLPILFVFAGAGVEALARAFVDLRSAVPGQAPRRDHVAGAFPNSSIWSRGQYRKPRSLQTSAIQRPWAASSAGVTPCGISSTSAGS